MRTYRLGQALIFLPLIFSPGDRQWHSLDCPPNSNVATAAFTISQEPAASSHAENSNELGREIGPKIKAMLPDDWSISYGPNSISLTRNQKVFIYSTANWPSVSKETIDEMVRRFGEEIVYRVTLRFIGRLTQNEYDALKREWKACHINNKPGPTFSIEKWSRAQECYRAKQPPVYYTKRYSVYLDQPDWWTALEIYPQSAANESTKVHESIDKLFDRYERVSKRR
jgi:hypothetical protein